MSIETGARINLPEGDHDTVLLSEPHRELVQAWTKFTDSYERLLFETYGIGHLSLTEAVPVIAYASVARVAWSLISAANILDANFDPVDFGKACERIANEQIARYVDAHAKLDRQLHEIWKAEE